MKFKLKKRIQLSKGSPTSESGSEKTACWLSGKLNAVQQSWAAIMGHLFNRGKKQTRKLVWIAIVLSMFGYSGLIIVYSFRTAKTTALKLPDSLRQPLIEHAPRSSIGKMHENKLPQAVIKFRHHLDSIEGTVNGKLYRDSINKIKPGLIDSIDAFNSLYCP